MSVTDRHKRPGGFKKLINSLEVTAPDKQAKILEVMRREDEQFADEVERHIFKFDEFKIISDLIMADVMHGMGRDMKSVAIALHKCQDIELLNKFIKNMPHKEAAAYKEESTMVDQITVSEQRAAQFRIIQKARDLQNAGLFVLKKYSPNYADT